MSSPRKKIVVYCSDLVEAERICFLLRTRKLVSCTAVCRILDVPKVPETDLVIIVSLSREAIDFQPVVDAYCSCPVLVWHRTQGATIHEFFDAVDIMLEKRRAPKPSAETSLKPAISSPTSREAFHAQQTA